MQQHEQKQFYEMWILACEPYGKNFVPTPKGLQFIFNVLSRYELSDIARALQAHALNPEDGRFAPKPADITRHVVGDTGSIAQKAWTQVITAIERVGTYESIVFDDPLIMATVRDMGGWLQLNTMTNESKPFLQNEFVTRYRGYLNNPPTSFPKQFVGLEAAGNSLNGYEEENTPRLWGNPEQCLLVYHNGQNEKKKIMRLGDFQEQLARLGDNGKSGLKLVGNVQGS